MRKWVGIKLDLFWIDAFFQERLIGFGLCTIDTGSIVRSLLSIYYADGAWILDIFWTRPFTK